MRILLDISLSPLPGCYDSQVSRFWGEIGISPRKHCFHMHYIPQSLYSVLSCIPFSAHTSILEVAWCSYHPSPVLGGKGGWREWGVGARRDSWAPARSSCWVSLLVTEISWEDSLFISLDSQSSDLRQGGAIY